MQWLGRFDNAPLTETIAGGPPQPPAPAWEPTSLAFHLLLNIKVIYGICNYY
jgi:hypothetical protein